MNQRLRQVATCDFRFIYSSIRKERIPRGPLLEEFARTFGTLNFDGKKWHDYAVLRVNVKPLAEERLAKVAQTLVREIKKAIEGEE